MFSFVSGKSAAAFCFAIALIATAQLQHGGVSHAQEGESRIGCQGGGADGFETKGYDTAHFLYVYKNCDAVAAALNRLNSNITGIDPIECGPGTAYGGALDGFLRVYKNCDAVAEVLNGLNSSDITGIQCYDDEYAGTNRDGYTYTDLRYILYVNLEVQCPAVTRALSIFIADDVEAAGFRTFFTISLPITGAVFVGSGYYAYNHLGGDDNLHATFWFALFVCFRVFDLMSDWGMYTISLASQHIGTALRYGSITFSIIGSILLILDLKTMRERAEHWFGVTDRSESLQTIGYGMLAIVLFEDVPQLAITSVYLSDIATAGRGLDAIAVTSFVLSVISMLANAFIAIRSLC